MPRRCSRNRGVVIFTRRPSRTGSSRDIRASSWKVPRSARSFTRPPMLCNCFRGNSAHAGQSRRPKRNNHSLRPLRKTARRKNHRSQMTILSPMMTLTSPKAIRRPARPHQRQKSPARRSGLRQVRLADCSRDKSPSTPTCCRGSSLSPSAVHQKFLLVAAEPNA